MSSNHSTLRKAFDSNNILESSSRSKEHHTIFLEIFLKHYKIIKTNFKIKGSVAKWNPTTRMSFENNFSCTGSIKSLFDIHKFNLCIPINLGAQVQTYVTKNKVWKTRKKECNLDKTELHILKRK